MARNTRLTLRTRQSGLSVAVGAAVALGAWEVAARILAASTSQGDRVVPSLATAATQGLLGVSDYWVGGLGIPATSQGGAQTIAGTALALGANALITLARVVVGLAIAIAIGVGLGLLVAALRPVRLGVLGVSEVIRMLPALAMAPLYTLWFGASDLAAIVFIVFSVAFILLVGTVNAIGNLRPQVLEFPRTLGVRGPRLWTMVVLPAILPELRGSLVFGGLVAWTSVLASEMNGLTNGLGWMLAQTLRFSLVDRMVIVAVMFSGLALATMKLLGGGVGRLTRWAE